MISDIKYQTSKLRKPSAILRKAAEVLKVETETTKNNSDGRFWRNGCCNALDEVEYGIARAIERRNSFGSYPYEAVQRTKAPMDKARKIFEQLYAPKRLLKTGDHTSAYWFGKQRTDKQQQHRIEALLLAAEIAESEGK